MRREGGAAFAFGNFLDFVGLALRGVLVLVALAYVGVTVFHLTNGFDIGSALVGGLKDARVAVQCIHNFEAIEAFVTRTGYTDEYFTNMLGSPYGELCP